MSEEAKTFVVESDIDKIRKVQAKPGTLGLPELLDRRRIEYGIPDGAFKQVAVWDRIFVHQIPNTNLENYGGGPIIKPGTVSSKERDESCRGVIVSAGFTALDHLRASGMDLGHIVHVMRLAPWRMPVDEVASKTRYVLIVRDGDLVGAEDLATDLRERPDAVVVENAQHLYKDREGTVWVPKTPDMPFDM